MTIIHPNPEQLQKKNQNHYTVLSLRRKFGYGVGGLGDNLAYNALSFYFIFYLTTVLGIQPLEAGLIVGIPMILLIPLDPLAGLLLDRIRSRFGRRRIVILISSPIAGICFFLLFYSPNIISQDLIVIYLLVSQIMFWTSSKFMLASYYATAAELSPSSKERTQLITIQQALGIVGVLIGSALTPLIATLSGGGQNGYARMGLTFGLLIVACFLTVFFAIPIENCIQEKVVSFQKEVLLTLRLLPFWIQQGIAFLVSLIPVVINSLLVFYMNYVLEIPDLLPLIMLFIMVISLLSFPLWDFLAHRWDQRYVFVLGISVYIFALLLLTLARELNLLWFLSIIIPAGIGNMAFSIFPKSLTTDLIVYDRALQGRSRASIINGLLGPIARVGTALGGILVGWSLEIVGYSSGVPLTPPLKDGLSFITGFVPSILLMLVIPLVLLYPLSKSKMESVEDVIRKNQ